MTLRDHFAGQALVSMVTEMHMPPSQIGWERIIAKNAYTLADAMMAQREKPTKGTPRKGKGKR